MGEHINKISGNTIFTLILVSFLGASFLFEALSGLIYGWMGMPVFQFAAFGGMIVLSILAVSNQTGLKTDEVFWNIAVGGVMGILVPLFAG